MNSGSITVDDWRQPVKVLIDLNVIVRMWSTGDYKRKMC